MEQHGQKPRGTAPASDFFRSPREMTAEAEALKQDEARADEQARTLAARYRRQATTRRNSAIRELMDRADKALRDRTPEQVEDDRRWGESVHASFEAIHGRPIAEFGIDRLERKGSEYKQEHRRSYRPIYDDKFLSDATSIRLAAMRGEDLEAYAEPHELDHDGGPVAWDQDEAEL